MSQPTKQLTATTRRLQQDWLELVTEPVCGVSATPINDDLFTWHANITPSNGPYKDTIFHLILLFPQDYPNKPPTVQLCTVFPHPNVFKWGGEYPYICLDMLKEHTSNKPYTGWTTAYTIQAILMQLSAFFFDAQVPQEYGGSHQNITKGAEVQQAIEKAHKFSCKCGHTHSKPYPSIKLFHDKIVHHSTSDMIVDEDMESKSLSSHFSHLSTDLIHMIFTYLSSTNFHALNHTCHLFRSVIDRYHMCIHRERICFYSKRSYEDEILGVGINAEYHPNGTLASITTPCLDLFSRSAYIGGLRVGVWKETFTYHLPLLINTQHSKNAFPVIERVFEQISNAKFTPGMALKLCCAAMNTLVVDFMRQVEETPKSQPPYEYGYEEQVPITLHTSEKALLGYCSYHHLLLGFAQRYPSIRTMANEMVNKFHKNPEYRTKQFTPNLGEFLICLTLSDLSWHQIAISFLIELMDRAVRWDIQKRPELSKSNGFGAPTLCQRLRWSFHYGITGKRLLMFQKFFLSCVRPDGIPLNLTSQLASYNRSLGYPPSNLAPRLQNACKVILECNYWDPFFDWISVKRLPAKTLCSLLEKSIIQSRMKGYHNNSHIGKEIDYSKATTTAACQCSHMEGSRNKHVPIHNGVQLCRCLYNDLYVRLAAGLPVVTKQQEIKQTQDDDIEMKKPTPIVNVNIASPNVSPVASPAASSIASPMNVESSPISSPAVTPISTPPPITSYNFNRTAPLNDTEYPTLGRTPSPVVTPIKTKIIRTTTTPPVLVSRVPTAPTTSRVLDDEIFPTLGSTTIVSKEWLPEGQQPQQTTTEQRNGSRYAPQRRTRWDRDTGDQHSTRRDSSSSYRDRSRSPRQGPYHSREVVRPDSQIYRPPPQRLTPANHAITWRMTIPAPSPAVSAPRSPSRPVDPSNRFRVLNEDD